MEIESTHLNGVVILNATVFGDDRGFFMETFHSGKASDLGIPDNFLQDNHSKSARGVLRGLHCQYPGWQGKLLRVISGAIYDVAVDLRIDSDTFGQWVGVELSADNKKQIYVPEGFAHGFCVLSETAEVLYKCTSLYAPQEELTLNWDDPDVGVKWPIDNPLLSDKDQRGLSLEEIRQRLAG